MLTLSYGGLAAYLGPGCAGAPSAGFALPDLAAYQWQSRVLVIDTPTQQSAEYLRQIAVLEAAKAGLQERNLQIVTRPFAPSFRVRLVGKDGGVKLNQNAPVEPAALFALIDAMPMRRAEISGR
jgi:hypothetical protein